MRSEMMKARKVSNSAYTVIVMSGGGGGGGCPRLLVSDEGSVLRDDYYGNMKVSKKLINKISSL